MSRLIVPQKPHTAGSGVQTLFVTLVVLALAAGAFWYLQKGAGKNPVPASPAGLSQGTEAVLSSLNTPVEIHFYTLLDKATVPAETFAFSDRVNALLAEYVQAGNGKISVKTFAAASDSDAASADGLRPFNLDKGDACFLGLSISCQGQKESFPQLSVEWEPALEADLSRAIARLSAARPNAAGNAQVSSTAPSQTAVEDLKRILPELATVTVAEGSQKLRDAALNDFKTATIDFESQVKEAQQRLADAQNGGSEADQQAAMKHLQELQAAQSEKLRKISARLQQQLTTLEQVKKP